MNTSDCLTIKCPVQLTLDLIGSKWSLLIVRELFVGNRRTHEFLKALPGISSKTLTMRLRELEAHGLITHKVYPEIPIHVEYSLTEKGHEIQPLMTALYQVGVSWLHRDDCDCPLNASRLKKS